MEVQLSTGYNVPVRGGRSSDACATVNQYHALGACYISVDGVLPIKDTYTETVLGCVTHHKVKIDCEMLFSALKAKTGMAPVEIDGPNGTKILPEMQCTCGPDPKKLRDIRNGHAKPLKLYVWMFVPDPALDSINGVQPLRIDFPLSTIGELPIHTPSRGESKALYVHRDVCNGLQHTDVSFASGIVTLNKDMLTEMGQVIEETFATTLRHHIDELDKTKIDSHTLAQLESLTTRAGHRDGHAFIVARPERLSEKTPEVKNFLLALTANKITQSQANSLMSTAYVWVISIATVLATIPEVLQAVKTMSDTAEVKLPSSERYTEVDNSEYLRRGRPADESTVSSAQAAVDMDMLSPFDAPTELWFHFSAYRSPYLKTTRQNATRRAVLRIIEVWANGHAEGEIANPFERIITQDAELRECRDDQETFRIESFDETVSMTLLSKGLHTAVEHFSSDADELRTVSITEVAPSQAESRGSVHIHIYGDVENKLKLIREQYMSIDWKEIAKEVGMNTPINTSSTEESDAMAKFRIACQSQFNPTIINRPPKQPLGLIKRGTRIKGNEFGTTAFLKKTFPALVCEQSTSLGIDISSQPASVQIETQAFARDLARFGKTRDEALAIVTGNNYGGLAAILEDDTKKSKKGTNVLAGDLRISKAAAPIVKQIDELEMQGASVPATEVKKMITAITSDPGALLSLVQVTTGQDIRKVLNKAMADESDAMRAEIGLLKTASADKDETMMAMKNTMEKMQEQLDKLTAAISAKDGDEGMTAS